MGVSVPRWVWVCQDGCGCDVGWVCGGGGTEESVLMIGRKWSKKGHHPSRGFDFGGDVLVPGAFLASKMRARACSKRGACVFKEGRVRVQRGARACSKRGACVFKEGRARVQRGARNSVSVT